MSDATVAKIFWVLTVLNSLSAFMAISTGHYWTLLVNILAVGALLWRLAVLRKQRCAHPQQ